LAAIYAFWTINFHDNARALFLSQGESEAWELVSKTKYIWEYTPQGLKSAIDYDNRGWFTFKNMHSELKALASTEKAGHGYNASLIIRDEVARHPYARENFTAVSRAVDSGGQLIELSTMNKTDESNYFTEKVAEFCYAPNVIKYRYPSGVELYTRPDKPKACVVFLSWNLRPVRYEGMTLEEWFETRIKTQYTQLQIEEQYPSTLEEALKMSAIKAYFDTQALEDMGYQLSPPIRQSEINTYNGIIRVYKPPIKGNRYVVFTDPSDGVEDPFVTGVMDYRTGEVVCTATEKVKVDFAAEIHDYLVRTYGGIDNSALNSYEFNGSAGGAFSEILKNLETPNQAPRRKPDGKIEEGKRGTYISGDYSKMMLGDLALAVTKRQFVIHDREFIAQASIIMRDEKGFAVMPQKSHNDWVMMMAGLWQLQKYIPRFVTEVRSYNYKRTL
jgi:hypothetical protein